MTRAEISAELDRHACEWRVPLEQIRDTTSRDGLVRSARIDFIRRMHRGGAHAGHVAWALQMAESTVHNWFRKIKRREEVWFLGE